MEAEPLAGRAALRRRFEELTQLLKTHRHVWEPRPFADPRVPWREQHPELYQWLVGRTAEEIDAFESGRAAPTEAPPPWRRWEQLSGALVRVPRLPNELRQKDERRLSWRVPGRKWQQIRAFAAAALGQLPPDSRSLVDWCSGKGHLGRLMAAASGLPVVHLERHAELCREGEELARRAGVEARFVAVDVHREAAWQELDASSTSFALHACGALTDELVIRSAEQRVRAVIVAPCCYHKLRRGHDVYRPLSAAGRAAGLPVDRGNLRLPTADEVVARPRRRRNRRRELAHRQGLDLLLREATGEDRYTPLGKLPRGLLDLPFPEFCRATAERLGLPLPARWDPATAERRGQERSRRARGLGLVRSLFRRPLELWLLLDRALYLAERGRSAMVARFCAADLTPRNLLICSRLEG